MNPQDDKSVPIAEMEQTVEDLKETIQQLVMAKESQGMTTPVQEKKSDRQRAIGFIKENARSAVTSSSYAAMYSGKNIIAEKGKISTIKDKALASGRYALHRFQQSLNAEQKDKMISLKEKALHNLQVLHHKGCLLLDDIISSPAVEEMHVKVQKGIEDGFIRLRSLKDREE